MQLTPVYGADPLIVLDGPPDAILGPVVRQRRRLVDALGRLDDEQWGRPTRCEGWDARDVIVHLDSTNSFWSFSIGAGVAGSPTRFLATFDPVASPQAPPNGESMAEFLNRVARAWAAASRVRAGLGGPLLVVSHGLVIRAALQHHARHAEAGLAPTAPVPVRMANTSLSAVDDVAPFTLRLFNCTAHLAGVAGVADDDGQSLSGG